MSSEFAWVTSRTRIFPLLALLTLAACSSAPLQPPAEEPPAEIEAPVVIEPPPPPEPDKSTLRITIASVGDMMIGTDFPDNHLPDDDGVGFFAEVADVLGAADVTFGNLEGVLMDGGEPVKKCSNPSACYLFRSPTRYAEYYRAAGFDVLSLANNHARDFGEAGRNASMQALTDAKILHSGRIGEFTSFERNGLRIAVLAYAVTRNSNMMLDYAYAETTVSRFAASHDIVIVSFHGGAEGRDVTHIPFAEEEYFGEPRGDVVRFGRMVVDAGADLVIGHGPHVVRGMENYKGRVIAYSLGNFATYYGISVAGTKGVAPVLSTTLDGNGKFIEGKIVSTVQLRPAGPSIDTSHRALRLISQLSAADFGEPGLEFKADGGVMPIERAAVEPREFKEGSAGEGGPPPCTEAWYWQLDSIIETSSGVEPEVGSMEWRSLVESELGLVDDETIPPHESTGWCAYVDALVLTIINDS